MNVRVCLKKNKTKTKKGWRQIKNAEGKQMCARGKRLRNINAKKDGKKLSDKWRIKQLGVITQIQKTAEVTALKILVSSCFTSTALTKKKNQINLEQQNY